MLCLLFGFCMFLEIPIGVFAEGEAGEPSTIITIHADDVRHELADGLYGTNQRYFAYGCGTWDPVAGKIYDEFQQLYQESGLRATRYPGGTTANTFWWKNAIGPVEDRKPNSNSFSGGGPEVAAVGIHEFAEFTEANGQEVIYVYNASNGNADDAAELVKYLNAATGEFAEMRAANGHQEPFGWVDFELGNEFTRGLGDGNANWCSVGKDVNNPARTPADLYTFGGTVKFTNNRLCYAADLQISAAYSDGSANQRKNVAYGPVDNPEEIIVKTGSITYVVPSAPVLGSRFTPDSDGNWTYVEDLTTAGPTDRVFTVNPENHSEIIFGDGINGAIPEGGKALAADYVATHDGVAQYVEKMKAAGQQCGVNVRIYSCFDTEEFVNLAKDIDYDGVAIHPYADDILGHVTYMGAIAIPYVSFPYIQANSVSEGNIKDYHNYSTLEFDDKTAFVRNFQSLLDQYAEGSTSTTEKKVIVTEFSNHGMTCQDTLYFGTMSNTVLTMAQLIDFSDMNMDYALRHCIADDFFGGGNKSLGLWDTGSWKNPDIYDAGHPKGEFLTEPAAYAYQIFNHMTGSNYVSSDIQNNPYFDIDLANGSRIFQGSTHSLQTLATADEDGTIFLFAVNRSQDNITAAIDIPGYTISDADIETLWHENIGAINTYDSPDNVTIKNSSVSVNGGSFSYDFPYCSIVGFKLNKANEVPEIAITGVTTGNKQANVEFAIQSANGKGYSVYLSETGGDGSFILYNNVNYNSKGAHIKGLDNGKTYYAYIEYNNGAGSINKSGVVTFIPGK